MMVFSLIGCQSSKVQSIDGETVYHMIQNEEDFVLVDVREEDEYNDGHIPGAILIPLGTIETDFESIVSSKEKEIVVYCRSGRRSKEAYEKIVRLGYENVFDLGGIIDWDYDIEK